MIIFDLWWLEIARQERQIMELHREVHHLKMFLRRMFCPVKLNLKITKENPLLVGFLALATITEFDANNNSVPVIAANLSASIDNPTVATVTSNADGTFTVTAIAPGTANLTVADSSNPTVLTDTVSITVEAVTTGPATSLKITLGTPYLPTQAASNSSVSGAQKVG